MKFCFKRGKRIHANENFAIISHGKRPAPSPPPSPISEEGRRKF